MVESMTRACRHEAGTGFVYLGRVELIQVKPRQVRDRVASGFGAYRPESLIRTDELMVSRRGLAAVSECSCDLDVYHRARGMASTRAALSVGFTSHYELINQRCGPVPTGIGGENLIVATDRRIPIREIGNGVHLCGSEGGIDCDWVRPLPPCAPFARFLLGEQADKREIRDLLRFLRGGLRGFALRPQLGGPYRVRVGDEVWGRPTSYWRSVSGPGTSLHWAGKMEQRIRRTRP